MNSDLFDAVTMTRTWRPDVDTGYSALGRLLRTTTTHTSICPDTITTATVLLSKGTIKKVIFNDPATIVFWSNGDKTVVKCCENDVYDPEKGLAMAICKYVFGNGNDFHRVFKDWLPEEKEAEASTSSFGVFAATKPVMDPFSKVLKSLSDTTELMGKIWGNSKKEDDHVE